MRQDRGTLGETGCTTRAGASTDNARLLHGVCMVAFRVPFSQGPCCRYDDDHTSDATTTTSRRTLAKKAMINTTCSLLLPVEMQQARPEQTHLQKTTTFKMITVVTLRLTREAAGGVGANTSTHTEMRISPELHWLF
jgi:hypothetical protein